MTERTGQGQADKKAAEDKTAAVAAENTADSPADRAKSAAEKSLLADSSETAVNPYPNYDMMTLEDLRTLAQDRGVEINRDVERAHLITELRAADSGGLSVPARRGAR